MLSAGVKWPWFCSSNNYIRKLITGVVPPLILTLWQGIVVPQWFYYWCQVHTTAARSVLTPPLLERILDAVSPSACTWRAI